MNENFLIRSTIYCVEKNCSNLFIIFLEYHENEWFEFHLKQNFNFSLCFKEQKFV